MMRSAYTPACNSIYRGIVESNIDPENLGRCKIRVPAIHGALTYPIDILPWARPIVLSPVGKNKGCANIPDVGDIVWVFFEGSDRDFPVYMGGTYARGDMTVSNDIIDIYLEGDNKISYDRLNQKYIIKVSGNSLEVTLDSINVIGNLIVDGDIKVSGSLEVSNSIDVGGDLHVSGHTTLSNLTITGSCNRECDCP